MKVAYFIGSLNRGGTETLVLDTFRRRDAAPYTCVLIYRNDGDLSDEYRATGVEMIRIKPRGIKVGYIRQLRKVLKHENVDILHAQTLLNAFLGLFCVCFSKIHMVVTFHGLFTSLKGRMLTHPVLWFADATIFVSDYVRQWYAKHTLFAPSRRCHVVHNGIDFSKFETGYPVPEFLEPVGGESSEQSVNLAMVGSFVSGRSQLFLCHCLKALRDAGVDGLRFFFVGRRSEAEPEVYDACVRFCESNDLSSTVRFVGGRSDVPAILQHIDGFVYSTVNDTFGIAVVEAMAVGVPVIVNDWDVMREITDNGELACLYKTQDVDDSVRMLQDFLKNRSSYRLSARANALVIKKRYSIEEHIRHLYAVYNQLLRKR